MGRRDAHTHVLPEMRSQAAPLTMLHCCCCCLAAAASPPPLMLLLLPCMEAMSTTASVVRQGHRPCAPLPCAGLHLGGASPQLPHPRPAPAHPGRRGGPAGRALPARGAALRSVERQADGGVGVGVGRARGQQAREEGFTWLQLPFSRPLVSVLCRRSHGRVLPLCPAFPPFCPAPTVVPQTLLPAPAGAAPAGGAGRLLAAQRAWRRRPRPAHHQPRAADQLLQARQRRWEP